MSEGRKNEGIDLEQDLRDDLKANQDAVSVASAEETADAAAKPAITMRDEAEKKPLLSANAKKEIREWVVSIAFALIAVFLIRTFLFTVISVDGQSMETTLHDGERLIVTVLDMKLSGPQRGDVVICHYPSRTENFVKRVIGVPGDVIWLKDGVTYVNSEPIPEPHIADPDQRSYGPYTLGEGDYFVMGDNRNHSNDSRSVGPLSRDMFIGKVRFVMWPLGGIRTVE